MRVFLSVFLFLGFIGVELNEVRIGGLSNGCAMDVLVGLMSPLSFTLIIIIPMILLNHQITEKNLKYQFVLRYRSWGDILRGELIKTVAASVLLAALFIAVVAAFSYTKKLPFYNWDSFDSRFFIHNGQILEVHRFVVFFYAFLCIAMRLILIQNILLLFLWGSQHRMVGMIAVLCITFDEGIRGDKLLCRLLSFDYDIWLSPFARIRLLLQMAGYLCIGVLLFRYFLSRKELLHCE
jgi:hypothetical protein